MKIWSYIEAHHEDFGVALFIILLLLLGLTIAGTAYGASLLFG